MDHSGIFYPSPGADIRNPATGMGYRLGRVLGEGAFGVTFECKNEFGERLVAKYLKPFRPREETEAEWRKEAHLLGMARHPYIIHIFDWFEFGNLYYLIVERAWGSVRDLVTRQGAFPPEGVREMGRQLLSALHFIHRQRIIHRDLQLDNVLYVGAGEQLALKISDFGISRQFGFAEGGYAFTNVGRACDVAPELLRAGYTSVQSDIYQVGLVLFFLLTGSPAVGPEDGAIRDCVLGGLAHRRAVALGNPLGPTIATMLQHDESLRFRSALVAWYGLRSAVPSASAS